MIPKSQKVLFYDMLKYDVDFSGAQTFLLIRQVVCSGQNSIAVKIWCKIDLRANILLEKIHF